MADGEGSSESPTLKAITTFLGWLAGIATLAYAGGVLIFALRMRFARLPDSLGTASALPRELLITVSLVSIGLPALVVGGAYALIRRAKGDVDPGSMKKWIGGSWSDKWNLLGWPVGVGIFLGLPGLILLSLPKVAGPEARPDIAVVVLVAMGASTLIAWIAIVVRDLSIRAFPETPRFNSSKAVALLAFMYALTTLPGSILVGAAIPFSDVKVCGPELRDEGFVDGSLIGITGDHTYVGEPGDRAKRRLAVISNDKVVIAYVGDGSKLISCPLSSRSANGGREPASG
jgi:hypothetical protein